MRDHHIHARLATLVTATEPATRNAERTRRAILDAAERSLREHGAGVSLVDIAAASGVSKSGLLHHFKTRNALLLAVTEDALERFRSNVMEFVDLAENHPGKVLRAYVRALCGGSREAMEFLTFSGLWNNVHMIAGATEAIEADGAEWTAAFARDGLHPDRILVVKHAAEGLAEAAMYDASIGEAELARGRQILLAFTDVNGAF